MKINPVEIVFEYILPAAGGVLTIVVVRAIGLQSNWWLLLIVPGALIFQWTVALALITASDMMSHLGPMRRQPQEIRANLKERGESFEVFIDGVRYTGECAWSWTEHRGPYSGKLLSDQQIRTYPVLIEVRSISRSGWLFPVPMSKSTRRQIATHAGKALASQDFRGSFELVE